MEKRLSYSLLVHDITVGPYRNYSFQWGNALIPQTFKLRMSLKRLPSDTYFGLQLLHKEYLNLPL